MTVVYVDILFLLNAYMTLFQLAATAKFCRVRIVGWRLLLASALGGLSGLLFFLGDFPVLCVAANLICAAVIILTAFRPAGAKAFFKRILCFCGCGAVFAGAVLLCRTLLGTERLSYRGGAVYFQISPLLLIGATAGCYLILRIFFKLTESKLPSKSHKMIVRVGKRSVTLEAVVDSGNMLCDPISGLPVAVTPESAVSPLFTGDAARFFCGDGVCSDEVWRRRVRLIPCKTVGGGGLLPGFLPDTVKIGNKDIKLLIAVSDKLDQDGETLLPTAVRDEVEV
ncbi:MAG TPA: sigma-E processing peptidase SpoIIGA [Oscillospiraceae bacterium]|nr:sigma-E processing peptidase SpoIIGA [Oscillospiraceae bacterium]HPK36484.1 sigma-E processing peptidase SpoIIGA [Oscillospiraceae bacterium]HPR76456.1 sigma-E processing peptidase SpoIIGA [Oscillospiraceae bacterium]